MRNSSCPDGMCGASDCYRCGPAQGYDYPYRADNGPTPPPYFRPTPETEDQHAARMLRWAMVKERISLHNQIGERA
jgi:hypothetical protein